jgi:hypothetical protein
MGPFASAIIIGCLDALRWLLWLVTALALAAMVAQWLRADQTVEPLSLIEMAAVCAVVGWICGFLGKRLAKSWSGG